MKVKELKWIDSISDGVIIASRCIVKIYDSIKIEFDISHDKSIKKYYLYSFGKGSIRRLKPDVFISCEDAKTAAIELYNNEMIRMKRAIDSFVIED